MDAHAEHKARRGKVQPGGPHGNNLMVRRTQTYFLTFLMLVPSGQCTPNGRGSVNWAGLLWSCLHTPGPCRDPHPRVWDTQSNGHPLLCHTAWAGWPGHVSECRWDAAGEPLLP